MSASPASDLTISAPGLTIPEVTHHRVALNGTELHYVVAGDAGTPILLVHGWPETWWAFRGLIPRLAATHRVYAVDLRGFGDSDNAPGEYGDAVSAEDLHCLIDHVAAGPMHVLCQDISGAIGFRLAATHPGDVLSLIAVETALAGYGFEVLADVTARGSWHVGFLAAPGIAALLVPGRERAMLADWAYPLMCATPEAVSDADLDEFVRTYARPDAWRGTQGLYAAALADHGAIRRLAQSHPLGVPVLTVEATGHSLTRDAFAAAGAEPLTTVALENVGHFIAQEAPAALAAVMLDFTARIDAG